ncbi:MAG: endonuclease Q family protein [Nanoarchaeota archaeon]|nr:endonuclease Q family protein [Nanoarchaeota archaeon]
MIADLHIHSKYSRACSSKLTIPNLEKWARIKGIELLGTGDFTHPEWFKHLKKHLIEEDGILKTESGFKFLLQTEISLMYTQDNKGRKIHQVVLAPSFDVVEQISDALLKRGRLDYDGRPIFKIPSPEFVELLRDISKDIEVIPAHCMTPHFGLFGASNQFNSVEECFKDQTKHIHALETGLSADPEMLFRIPQIDNYLFISSSDSHSFWPWRIGREATIFNIKPAYKKLLKAIRTKEGFNSTIEFWPQEGKYHYTGHRKCNICLHPKEAMKINNICPKCNQQLTIGVAQRVEELASRPEGFKPKNAQPTIHLIPLAELIANAKGHAVNTKSVWGEYNNLIRYFSNEFEILLKSKKEDLLKITSPKIVDLILKNREEKLRVLPGYDGVYGKLILADSEMENKQKGLNDFF